MIRTNKFKKNNGIILIEAIIALGVIVIVMTALVTALVSALNSTTYSNEQTLATAYAQEGLEIARAQKNRDFSGFQNLGSSNCLGEGATSIPSASCYIDLNGDDNKFIRRIIVDPGGGDCDQEGSIFVSSVVYWNDSRCSSNLRCHEVALSSCFTNLNYINLGNP